MPAIQGTTIEGAVDDDIDKDPVAEHHLEQRPVRTDIPLKSYWQRMPLFTTTASGFDTVLRHTYQPFIVISTFPGVAFVTLLYGSLLAWLAIVLSLQGIYLILPPYNFSSSGVGLFGVPTFIGSVLGGFYGGQLSDYSIQWLAKRNGGLYEPEMRLWLALPTILITPAGYFLFGLSLSEVS